MLKRKEVRRPMVSATTPVGISNRAILAVNAALAMKTPRMLSPASSKNKALTPQINEADSVYSPAMAR
jgi:hypothetical protein